MESQKNIEQVVARVGDLPALPEIVQQVLEMTEDASVDMMELSDLLEKDPGLTAKLLRVTNSAYYGMRQYVGTLKLALVILGVREVRNVVFGVSLFDSLRGDSTESLLGTDFWSHSFVVAAVAKELSTHMGLSFHGEDFTAGLLHDVGKMVLAGQISREYAAVFKSCQESESVLYLDEKEKLGFTHADAGAAIAARWSLPQTLTDAIWLHHPSEWARITAAKDPSLCAVVRIANLAAHEDFPNSTPNDAAACSETEAWSVLDQAGTHTSPEARFELLARVIEGLDESADPFI